MKLKEIYDGEHERRLNIAKGMVNNYGNRPKVDPNKKSDYQQYNQKKNQIEKQVGEIAIKYKANQFNEFKHEVLSMFEPSQLKYVDLQTVFDLYNPDRIKQQNAAWDAYGRARQQPNSDIHGKGTGNLRNWTGD